RLTARMFQDFVRLRQYEETADVLQNATLRLLRALEAVRPTSVAEFFRLAGRQIRRELIDLSRHHFGPLGAGAHEQALAVEGETTTRPLDVPAETHDPSELAQWREFHELIERLPQDERDVFDLLWYQELTQAEAAEILGVSIPTIKRRWLSA